jgi:hypothetical protein
MNPNTIAQLSPKKKDANMYAMTNPIANPYAHQDHVPPNHAMIALPIAHLTAPIANNQEAANQDAANQNAMDMDTDANADAQKNKHISTHKIINNFIQL